MTYCLDSWAVMQWLEGDEPGAIRVETLLSGPTVMSWINAGEVYYLVARKAGHRAAQETLDGLRVRIRLDEAIPERVLDACRIKADYPMALGDAFAVATAQAHNAVLVTGDREIVDAGGPWSVEDLRG